MTGTPLSYAEVLRQAGYPEQIVGIDFETYFDPTYRLGKKSSMLAYLADPRFEILGMGCVLYPNSGRSHFWENAASHLRWLQDRFGGNLEGCTVAIQNSRFDCAILARQYGIKPRFVIDTLGLARYLHPGSPNNLASLCKRYGMPDKGDTEQFSGVRRSMITPEQATALAEYCNNDVERMIDLMTIMLPLLGNPVTELALMRHTLEMYISPIFRFDAALAENLCVRMNMALRDAVAVTGHRIEDISGTNSFVAILQDAGIKVAQKVGKAKMIPALSKKDEAFQDLLVNPDPRVRILARARSAVKSWPLHIKRVQGIAAQARAEGGLLRIPLVSYGAHTGRWSGCDGQNYHNLPSRSAGLTSSVTTVAKRIPSGVNPGENFDERFLR